MNSIGARPATFYYCLEDFGKIHFGGRSYEFGQQMMRFVEGSGILNAIIKTFDGEGGICQPVMLPCSVYPQGSRQERTFIRTYPLIDSRKNNDTLGVFLLLVEDEASELWNFYRERGGYNPAIGDRPLYPMFKDYFLHAVNERNVGKGILECWLDELRDLLGVSLADYGPNLTKAGIHLRLLGYHGKFSMVNDFADARTLHSIQKCSSDQTSTVRFASFLGDSFTSLSGSETK